MNQHINIIVIGYKGRMGQRIAKLIDKDPSLKLVAGIDIGDSLVDKIDEADVIIDFSRPEATLESVKIAAKKNKAIVIGTTGFSDEELKILEKTSQEMPLLLSSNMSRGVNIMFALTDLATKLAGTEFEINLSETHHVHKKDKPSGTAKTMIEIIRSNQREAHIESFREGEVIGNHEITFSNEDETLTISHKALNRDIFARGAIKAAKWLIGKKPGLYTTKDILENK